MLACAPMRAAPPAVTAAALALLATALLADGAGAQPAELDGNRLVDRILAVVDEDPILMSEIEEVIGLGLAEPRPGEGRDAFRARVLDALVDERLRFHEVDRFGFAQVPVALIEERVAEVRSRFASAEDFARRLAELRMGEDELRQLVARQLMVLTYVDERLGARVFVGLDDIRAYYDRELVPAMRAEGQTPPSLEAVREDIRAVLKQQRLNEEIARWTEELRLAADIQLFLDEPDSLPPVVEPAGDGRRPGRG